MRISEGGIAVFVGDRKLKPKPFLHSSISVAIGWLAFSNSYRVRYYLSMIFFRQNYCAFKFHLINYWTCDHSLRWRYNLDNSVIKLPCANRLAILYPFVYIVLRWMNSRSINCNHLNGVSFYSRCIFSLNMFLGLKSVAKDLKMDLGRVVVITAKSKSENSLSFRAPIVLFWSEWVHLN